MGHSIRNIPHGGGLPIPHRIYIHRMRMNYAKTGKVAEPCGLLLSSAWICGLCASTEFELELFPIASDCRIRPRPDAFGQDIALTLIYLSVWQELRGYIRSRANRQSEQFGRRGRRIYKERSQSTSTTVYVFRQTVVVTMFTATRGQFRRFLLGRRLNHCCM